MPAPAVIVVGIGADGWDGLSTPAQSELRDADVIFGSERQLALLPGEVTARRRPWPSPLLPALDGLLAEHAGRRVAVLASGDPMHYGIGSTLARRLGPDAIRVVPHPSSMSLACARLGWPVEDVEIVSAVGRPLATLHAALQPGRRLLVLTTESSGAAEVAALLVARGFGASEVTVLEQLGGPAERRVSARADAWAEPAHDPLAIVAVDCADGPGLSRVPGLPESAYDTDGQITKRDVRAITLARLAPLPGQLLWDIGAGSGSVAVEWLRTHPACRAVAIEPRADRCERIAHNAAALGVPTLRVVPGSAPEALAGLEPPDAVFVGGAVSEPGVLAAAHSALRPGGRLVANAVTLQGETTLVAWHARLGGELTRIDLQRAEPLGGLTTWRPALPVVQWTFTKEE